ncbi:MAG: TIGR04086 family membrane protein [Eubacteriales bacterium]|nr:TIGR04086 family membrane protein [Eubacteriales bacterium]
MPKYKKTRRPKRESTLVWKVTKAALIACLAVLVLLILTTLMLAWGWIGEGSITIVNTILKVLGAALAGFLIGRCITERTWLLGAISATLFQLLAVISMCIFLGEIHLNWSILGDILMSAAIGAAIAATTKMMRRPAS